MGKRRFILDFLDNGLGLYEDSAVIELDDAVIDVVDDEWRKSLYNLHTPQEIAEHIGYNLIVNKISLSQMDGWADQPDSNAKIIEWPDLELDWKIEATEIIEID